MGAVPQRGDFVCVRSRRWLVEDERPIDGLKALRLAETANVWLMRSHY